VPGDYRDPDDRHRSGRPLDYASGTAGYSAFASFMKGCIIVLGVVFVLIVLLLGTCRLMM
jgi:hypothetical protein